MARSHARIFVTIWQDPEFTGLSPDAQRVFFLVLSQSKLSNAGVIDYRPARWARYSRDTYAEEIQAAINELERERFVVIDYETEELLLRTFVKNDGMCQRWQMVSAMWSAWEVIESPMLRRYVLDWLPDEAWNTDKAPPPKEAESLRHSEPIATRLPIVVQESSEPSSTPNSLLPSPTPTPAPTPASTALAIRDDAGFDVFWEQYPARNGKKIDKAKAVTAWGRLSAAKKTEAMTGVGHYRDACDRCDTIARDPHRWLRDESWRDWQEPAVADTRRSRAAAADQAGSRVAALFGGIQDRNDGPHRHAEPAPALER